MGKKIDFNPITAKLDLTYDLSIGDTISNSVADTDLNYLLYTDDNGNLTESYPTIDLWHGEALEFYALTTPSNVGIFMYGYTDPPSSHQTVYFDPVRFTLGYVPLTIPLTTDVFSYDQTTYILTVKSSQDDAAVKIYGKGTGVSIANNPLEVYNEDDQRLISIGGNDITPADSGAINLIGYPNASYTGYSYGDINWGSFADDFSDSDHRMGYMQVYREDDPYHGSWKLALRKGAGNDFCYPLTYKYTGRLGIYNTSPSYALDVGWVDEIQYARATHFRVNEGAIYFDKTPAPGACTAAIDGAAGPVSGTNIKYKIVFETAMGTTGPGSESNTIATIINGKINLTSIPTGYDNVIARKIYRISTEQGAFYWFLLTTISNNTETTYTDNTTNPIAWTEEGTLKTMNTAGGLTSGISQFNIGVDSIDCGSAIIQQGDTRLNPFPIQIKYGTTTTKIGHSLISDYEGMEFAKTGQMELHLASQDNGYTGIGFRGAGARGRIDALGDYNWYLNPNSAYGAGHMYLNNTSEGNIFMLGGGGNLRIGDGTTPTFQMELAGTLANAKLGKTFALDAPTLVATKIADATGTLIGDTFDYSGYSYKVANGQKIFRKTGVTQNIVINADAQAIQLVLTKPSDADGVRIFRIYNSVTTVWYDFTSSGTYYDYYDVGGGVTWNTSTVIVSPTDGYFTGIYTNYDDGVGGFHSLKAYGDVGFLGTLTLGKTTEQPQLIISSGALISTPRAGAIEWNSSGALNLYFSPTTTGRYAIPLIGSGTLDAGYVLFTTTNGFLAGTGDLAWDGSTLVVEGSVQTTQIVDTNTNEELKFSTTTSAVNEFTITNAATANRPVLSSTGGDTNIDIGLTPKGSGAVVISTTTAQSLITNGLVVNNAGTGNSYDDFIAKTDTYAVGLTVDASADAVIIAPKLVFTPSTTQSITAVGNTVLANATLVVLDPNGNYTLTSAPTIADGTTGQILYITAGNAEASTVTLQDQDTLASSNLQLGAATRAITGKKVLCLIFDGTDWLEVSYANN